MFNFNNTLLAANYIIPLVAGVAALVLLIVLLVITKSSSKKNDKDAEHLHDVAEPLENDTSLAETVDEEEQPTVIAEESTEELTEDVTEEENHAAETVETVEPIEEIQSVEEVETVEEVKTTEQASSVETSDLQSDDNDNNDDVGDEEDDKPIRSAIRENGTIRYIIIKYNKSYTAKLIQSDTTVKSFYTAIKNELLSYKGIKSRFSWKGETFYCGRQTYAKLCIRGKCLSLFLALDAKTYEDTKYKVEDMSEVAAYEKTPCLYRIKNERRLKYSFELIEEVMYGREKAVDYTEVDFAKQYPYEKIEPLIERKLVKVLTEEDAKSGDVFKPRDMVTASEVDELMQDEIAVALIEESDEVSDKTKAEIINIDTLSKTFADGETVTLEEVKKRVEGFPKRATYLKVLARGKLDKKLIVIADSFSIEAAKMILLTGGNAIKKKNS